MTDSTHAARTHHGRDRRRWRPDEQDDRPRLFFAIPIPTPARDAVEALAERVRDSTEGVRARWVRFEGLHFTLRFLGPTAPEDVPTLAAALDDVADAVRPFSITLGGGGAFPGIGRPRTLWIGVTDGAGEIEALAHAISTEPRVAPLVPQRPPWTGPADGSGGPPARRFAPHLTIARTDGVRGAAVLARAIVAEAEGLAVRFTADRVILFQSHLGGGPARYEALHEAPLHG